MNDIRKIVVDQIKNNHLEDLCTKMYNKPYDACATSELMKVLEKNETDVKIKAENALAKDAIAANKGIIERCKIAKVAEEAFKRDYITENTYKSILSSIGLDTNYSETRTNAEMAMNKNLNIITKNNNSSRYLELPCYDSFENFINRIFDL